MEKVRWVQRLAATCVALTFLIMVLGAWVKATDSGLACPDWPACYGQWLPPFPSVENGGLDPSDTDRADAYTQAQVLYEWTHRAVVSLFGIPMLALAFLAFRDRDHSRTLRWLPIVTLVVLALQILIGKLTVNVGNKAWATTLHLATATVIVVLVTATMVVSYLRPYARPGEGPRHGVHDFGGRAGARFADPSHGGHAPRIVPPGPPAGLPDAPARRAPDNPASNPTPATAPADRRGYVYPDPVPVRREAADE